MYHASFFTWKTKLFQSKKNGDAQYFDDDMISRSFKRWGEGRVQIIPWVYVRRFNAHAYKDWITSMALEHGSHFKTGKHTDCFIWIPVCICFLIKTRYGFKYISSENMCIFLFYKCWLFHCDFHFVKILKTCSILLIHDKHSLLYA